MCQICYTRVIEGIENIASQDITTYDGLKMHEIPKKYKEKDVLHTLLLESIRDNWERIRYEYTAVLENLGENDSQLDIDKALLGKLRKDIRQDGPGFLEAPDGIGSRLRNWLVERFPHVLK